jgi:hypothetical protein
MERRSYRNQFSSLQSKSNPRLIGGTRAKLVVGSNGNNNEQDLLLIWRIKNEKNLLFEEILNI